VRTKDGNANDYGDLPMFGAVSMPDSASDKASALTVGKCPTCGVKTTEWRKRIISTAVASLCRLVFLYDSIPIHHDEFTVLKKDRNFSQLVFWGLVSPGVNPEQLKRSAGTWEPTSKGVAFVNGGLLIQSHLVTYDNKLVGFSGELIDVVWALNNKFDFRVLLSENFKGKNT
jgi:hypothetical protein